MSRTPTPTPDILAADVIAGADGFTPKTSRERTAYANGYSNGAAVAEQMVIEAFANGKAEGLAESTEAAYGRGYAAAFAELDARITEAVRAREACDKMALAFGAYSAAVTTAAEALKAKADAVAKQATA